MVLRSLLLFLFASFSVALSAQADPCGTVTISGADSLFICQGDEVTLRQTNTLADPIIQWSPAEALLDPVTDPAPRVNPAFNGFVRVTVSAGGCEVSDSVYFDVDRQVLPELIDPTEICQGVPTDLLRTPITDAGSTNYLLIGGDDDTLAVSRDPNFVVTLLQDSTFTIISNSDNGACTDSRSVRLTVVPGTFDIAQDTIFSCLGADSITLSVSSSPASSDGIRWSPDRFSAGEPTGGTFRVLPVADITYFARATINGCARVDSVNVRLDSLPQDLSMELDPEKDPYCQGDTFYVLSPIFDAGDFPIITHEWTVSPGLQSPRDLYNAVFVAQDTALLTRVTTNGACVDTTSIQVNVVTPPQVEFTPVDPVVCPGDTLQITATFITGSGSLSWEDPGNTLSCTDCLNPIARVQTDTEYTITVESDASDCTSELTYAIRVVPNINPQLTEQTLICAGDSRQLITGGTVSGYTYRITGGGIDTTDVNVSVSPTETTTYTIETDGDCGLSSQEITLVVAEDYGVSITGTTTVCAGEDVQLTATVDPAGITGSFLWTLPNGVSRTGATITEPGGTAGTYTVTFTDDLGCSTATASIEVEVIGQTIEPVIVATLPNGTTLQNGGAFVAGTTVVLSVINVPDGLNFTYNWAGNYDPATASAEQISVTVPRAGTGLPDPLDYTVTLTSDPGGCTSTARIFLPVEQSQVQAPDFFTPDNDGRNDRFRLFFNGQITDYTMIVYDRWGQKVFNSSDPLEGWDGTKNGTPQTADVYLFLAKFRQDGVELEQEGQVSLLR